MDDKIKKEIENNNLIKAKELIEKLETDIYLEKSDYSRVKMQEKLNLVKNLYADKISINKLNMEKNKFQIESLQKKNKTKNIKIFENILNLNINEKETFSSVIISNCNGCTFHLKIEQSLVIMNCKDIKIYISSSQIRIKNSINVTLIGFIKCGISLEDSTNIKIKGDLKENNNFKNIKDFNDPLSSKNFSFFE